MDFVQKTEPSTDTSWQGNCYGNAIEFLVEHRGAINYLVCHGIVRGQGPNKGNYIAHAWVEDEHFAYDHDASTNNVTRIPKGYYYHLGDIDPNKVKRYNPAEVVMHATETGHGGPWDEELYNHAIHEEGSVYEPIEA